jgi:hypothetical protein
MKEITMNMLEQFTRYQNALSWNFSIRTVTPELAKALLENNAGNRNLRKAVAARYAAIMRAGKWLTAPEPIVLGTSGRVLNGQHRLFAVIMADMSADFCFITGVSDEAFKVIDRGLTRSTADALSIPRSLVEIAKCIVSLTERVVSDDKIEVFCETLRPFHDAIEEACSSRRALLTSAPMRAAAAVRLMMGDDPDHVLPLYRNMVLGHVGDLPPVGQAMISAVIAKKVHAGGLTATRANFARGFFLFDPENRDKTRIPIGPNAIDKRIDELSKIMSAVTADLYA